MCLLSVYSPGAMVNVEHLEAGAYCNPDGYGFALIVGDRIEVAHGMDAFATIDAFERVRTQHPESWALFHSRYTTDGETNEENCHPFLVGGDRQTVLAHNGVLPKAARPGRGDTRSDTRILAESLIPGGMFGRLHRMRSIRSLERWLTSEDYPNKVAILTVDPRYKDRAFILNEKAGTWVDGVWHSNDGYRPYEPLSTYRGGDDSPFTAYMRGRISYSEYVDLKYGITKERTDCPACFGAGTVDVAFMYCKQCKMCLDCYEFLSDCDCWVPHSERVPQPGSTETAEELSPAVIDAALEKLPADAAARVREALNVGPDGQPL